MEQAGTRLPLETRLPSLPLLQAHLQVLGNIHYVPVVCACARACYGRGHKENSDVSVCHAGLRLPISHLGKTN